MEPKERASKAAKARWAKKSPAERTEIATNVATARWATEEAAETDMIDLFREIDIEKGMTLLAKMRNNCTVAATTINQRLSPDDNDARCFTCEKKKNPMKRWVMVTPRRDPVTMLATNRFFCSEACIVRQNQKEGGVAGLADRGMIKGETPTTR